MPVVAPEPSEWDRFAGLPAGDPVPLDTVDEIRALRARLVIGNILTRNEWAAIPLAMDRLLAMHDEVVAALREARAEIEGLTGLLTAITPSTVGRELDDARAEAERLALVVTSLMAMVEAKALDARIDIDHIDGLEAERDEARAERDAFLAALGAIATLPSASIAVRDIARHALLNGGAS